MTDTKKQPVRQRHPVVEALELRRAQDVQLKIADAITAFTGSMAFVYLHMVAEIHTLTTELHRRLLPDTGQDSR